MPGFLLVEFLSDDPFRQYRTEWFPFLLGFGREHGVATRWVTLQAGRSSRPENYYIVEPPRDDVERLVAAVREAAPSAVLLNEKPGPGLAAALARVAPDVRFLVAGDDTPRYDEPRVAQVASWMGLPSDDPSTAGVDALISDGAIPDYGSETLNPGTHDVAHYVWLKAGICCTYARSVAANPCFQGVDLSGALRTAGCSFCQGSFHGAADVRAAAPSTPPVDLAILQLRRHLETAPPERRHGLYMIDGAEVFQRLARFFERVLELPLPPSEFRFARRADEVLARIDDLEAWLPRLAAHGHRVALWAMGVENFSEPENLRLNKGVSVATYELAASRVLELERRWPDALPFSQVGGPSMILFTPWTTLDDLAANVAVARRLDLDTAYVFSTRLTLMPGAPITALAERDGLVAPSFGEPFLPASCAITWDAREVPWRFLHDEVVPIFRAMIRLTPRDAGFGRDAPPQDDPLWVRLAPVRDALARHEVSFLDAFEALVDAARAAPPAAPADVVGALLARCDRPVARPTPPPDLANARPSEVFLRSLAAAIRFLEGHAAAGAGARVVGVGREDRGAFAVVEVDVGAARASLRCYDGPGEGARSYFAGKHVCAVHDADTPISTPALERSIRLLLTSLDRVLGRVGSAAPASAPGAHPAGTPGGRQRT